MAKITKKKRLTVDILKAKLTPSELSQLVEDYNNGYFDMEIMPELIELDAIHRPEEYEFQSELERPKRKEENKARRGIGFNEIKI